MGDFIPLQPSGGRDQRRSEGAGLISEEDELDDPHAFTNFNPAPTVEERSGDLSRMTWIMTITAGVVLGAVMTFIAAGS